MTPEEELFTIIKSGITSSVDIQTATGDATPKVFYWKANANTEYPYFTYNLKKVESFDRVIFTGRIEIAIWFYSSDALKALQCQGYISELFNNKYIIGTNLLHCRLWHLEEERKETERKDLVKDKEVIAIELAFDARWATQTRISSQI